MVTGPVDLSSDPRLERIWHLARRRIEAGGGCGVHGAFTVPEPTADERVAAQLLLGRRFRGRTLRISLEDLDRALAGRGGLIALLERRGGPLRDRPAERRRAAREEEGVWVEAAEHPALRRHATLREWLDRLRSSGSLRGTMRERAELLHDTLTVLAELPADDHARSVLAADLFGDAHALDDGRPAGRMVLAALAHLGGEPPPNRAADRGRLWERWGVAVEGATSRVLVLALRPAGDSPVARGLRELADSGLPVPVTLPMLLALAKTGADAIAEPAPTVAFVCENPTILEVAARRLGTSSPLLVSTEGMPSVAARRLFEMLTAVGTELRYHGDFGAGGLRIGNVVIGECHARPWRFCAADYRAALGSVRDTTPIRVPVPDAGWDPDLAPLLRAEGREIHEEQILATLLDDLFGHSESAEGSS